MSRNALLLSILLLAGCESPRSRVFGSISRGGQPLTNVTVVFLASDNQAYQAYPKADGTYEVSGLPRGRVKVAVIPNLVTKVDSPRPPPGAGRDFPESAADDAAKGGRRGAPIINEVDPFFAKYADPEQSGLEFELTEANQEYTIDLK